MNPKAALLKEIIAGRASIRRFRNDPVPEELIREVLDAGRLAPSPTNTQPWYFLVVSGDDTKIVGRLVAEDIQTIQLPGFRTIARDGARILAEAPHVITVWNMGRLSRRLKKIRDLVGGRFYLNYERAERDAIACAVENMWLTAHALGLGLVWIMASRGARARFVKAFGVEGEIAALLALGYPAEGEPGTRPGRKPLEEVAGFHRAR